MALVARVTFLCDLVLMVLFLNQTKTFFVDSRCKRGHLVLVLDFRCEGGHHSCRLDHVHDVSFRNVELDELGRIG